MDDLSRFCCLNKECTDYGKRGAGNLHVYMNYGKNKQRRLLLCKTCGLRFSERKGTPLFKAHLPEEKVISILEHICEGCGVRKTARLVRVKRATVSHYCQLAGKHAKELHDELVAFSPSNKRGSIR